MKSTLKYKLYDNKFEQKQYNVSFFDITIVSITCYMLGSILIKNNDGYQILGNKYYWQHGSGRGRDK